MKQCETCIHRDFKEFLAMCDANAAAYHWHEFLKSLPIIGKYVKEYKCAAYKEADAP